MNILHNRYDIEECKVLDLYSGTGNIALELWSRGSRSVHSVESHPQNVRYIKAVAAKLNADVKVHRRDVVKFLKETGDKYDLIFADPPYATIDHQELINLIYDLELLLPGGTFVLEHASMTSIQDPRLSEQRTYGQSIFSFFTFD